MTNIAPTSAQIRAARAALNLKQRDVAAFVGVTPRSVRNWEAKPGQIGCSPKARQLLYEGFRARGVELVSFPVRAVRILSPADPVAA